jgi:sugar O-acyltransferase (sialic acid O-acetyltransferase NeuD family)
VPILSDLHEKATLSGQTPRIGVPSRTVSDWILYACRTPYAVEVAESIWRRGEEVVASVDNIADVPESAGDNPAEEIGAPIVRPEELTPEQRQLPTAIPLITPGHRFAVEAEARALGLESFPALLDPTAVIARTATIGRGAIVNAATVIAAATAIGRFAHVNRSASIGHHNEIEAFATVGPGCVLAGHVRVGRGAFLGAGVVCTPKVRIGGNAVVGAGAVVVRDVPAGAVAVGNPAKVIREGKTGYGGVAVPEPG